MSLPVEERRVANWGDAVPDELAAEAIKDDTNNWINDLPKYTMFSRPIAPLLQVVMDMVTTKKILALAGATTGTTISTMRTRFSSSKRFSRSSPTQMELSWSN